ncbi:MAG: DUF6599 family protein [Acidobacteriota bacterium]
MAESLEELYAALPAEAGGWKKSVRPETYEEGNLSDYIDGGAELYISYNFQKLLAVRYKDREDAEIVVDIFDMGSSSDAFGVFSHGREREDHLVGQGSEYNAGLLTFWKDRYYVSILAYPETPEKKGIVLSLGRVLAEAIAQEGALPPVLTLLPEEELIAERTRYFHHYIWLNSHFFISNDNILNIDDETQAVLAKYGKGEDAFFLLIARYPDAEKARKAEEGFLKHYLLHAKAGAAKLDNGRWTGCRVKGEVLSIVFNAPTKEILDSYLGMVETRVSE